MTLTSEMTAQEWFTAAGRWYIPSHQGCFACRAQHCVYHSSSSNHVEYYCSICEFFVRHDLITGKYMAIPGECAPLSIRDADEVE
jgi:hypothetical protein